MHKSLFYTSGVFLTWGIKNGTWEPEVVATLAKHSGFTWIAQQVGDPNTQPRSDEILRLRGACRSLGLEFGIWQDKPRDLSLFHAYTPNFFILDVESDRWPGYNSLLNQLRRDHPQLSVGVSTDCDIDHHVFQRHNVKVMPQAYQVDDAAAGLPPEDHHTPANMVGLARRLGWQKVFPTVGVYHDYPLSEYQLRWGSDGVDGWSVYNAEGMTDQDWATAKELNHG